MTNKEFAQMLRSELGEVIALSEVKGGDYSGKDDTLRFFKDRARELGTTPQMVWAVLAGKHWSAIMSAAKEAGNDGYSPSEPVAGRVRDLVVYLFLFLAMDSEIDDDPEESVADDDLLREGISAVRALLRGPQVSESDRLTDERAAEEWLERAEAGMPRRQIDPDATYVIRRRDGLFLADRGGGTRTWSRYDERAPLQIPGREVEAELAQLPDDCFPVAADAPLAHTGDAQ